MFVCVMLLAVGCGGLEIATPTPQPPRQATTLEGVWREVGEARGLPGDALDTVAEMLTEVVAIVQKEPDEEFLSRFYDSLPRFLDAYEGCWKWDRRGSDLAGRWLAWCVAEALNREPLTPEQIAARTAEYRALCTEWASQLEQMAFQQLPDDAPDVVKSVIINGLAEWRDDAMTWITQLQDDLLFPALRGPVSEKMRRTVQEYGSPEFFPPWEGVRERFMERMKTGQRKSLSSVLFWSSMADASSRVHENRYWVYNNMAAWGGGEMGGWPITGQLYVQTTSDADEAKQQDGVQQRVLQR